MNESYDDYINRVIKDTVANGEITHYKPFLLLTQWLFKMMCISDVTKCICMWERDKEFSKLGCCKVESDTDICLLCPLVYFSVDKVCLI